MFRIPLAKPFMTAQIKDCVCAVLDSGFLTEGPVTKSLEEAFRHYTGSRYALAVTSCTTGLELALRGLGIGPGDEVIVPDFTYPATADAVAVVGATVVLVDVTPETFLIDYDAIDRAITPRTRAIIPVSEFGNPLDHDQLRRVKEQYGIWIVEDAACALGSCFGGICTGNLADITVFSMHPRKFITTGEGGIITTNNPAWAEWMDAYKHFGIQGKDQAGRPIFRRIGSNLKMSDIQAAVGVEQMKHIRHLLQQRRNLAARYHDLLSGQRHCTLPRTTPGGEHSWQSYCVRIPDRDLVLNRVRSAGIEVQFGAFALHMQPAFAPGEFCRWSGTLHGSKQAFEEALALPLHHDLSAPEQEEVVAALATNLRAAA